MVIEANTMQVNHGASILDPAVISVLSQRVLQQLHANELGRLACACKGLRTLVGQADVHVWRLAAATKLHPAHPALVGDTPTQICTALRQDALAQNNLRAGIWSLGPEINCAESPLFSPDGRQFLVRRPSHHLNHELTVHDACKGTIRPGRCTQQ